MTKVMLVEDHAAFRAALALLLDREPEIQVIAQAGTLAEARRLLTDKVDVAVVDLTLPDGNGSEFIKDLRRLNPRSTALVLSASVDPTATAFSLEAGAAEALNKSEGIVEIAEAVKRLRVKR